MLGSSKILSDELAGQPAHAGQLGAFDKLGQARLSLLMLHY
jgi:hypothetical protein